MPKADLEIIEKLVRAKADELKETIALRREQGFEAAAARIKLGAGKETMDALRSRLLAVHDQQEAALSVEGQQIDDATRLRTVVFLASALINLCFLVWAYRRIRSTISEREAALAEAQAEREEVRRQKELLAVTLASIGDCVIVTNPSGRITFMNTVAEALTGWMSAEAIGRPVGEIFRIINEESRAPVESPVDKVLRDGVTVGLANHTLLIRKDGSEVPIDDSGAPIKEEDGKIRGVILVFRDFSEHKETERILREATETAQTANAAKDQFLAMLSHELRTPLTPVLATLNLWETSDDVPAHMKGGVQMLRRSVELEARIIDDLLDLTRIAKGILSFTRETIDVHELIEFLVAMCHSEFHGKELGVSVELNAGKHYLHTDAGRLQQILWNVIRNAAKFTGTGGKVCIATANDSGGNVVITVTDNGIGMTEETMDRLFHAFEQGEKIISRRSGGLGLGMAISSALVSQLGGELSAFSEGLGKGSTFTITFPSTEERPTRKEQKLDRDTSLAGLKVLLLEDHEESARALTQLLTRQGYVVRVANTIAAAMATAAQSRFDVLICDIGLPDGTGYHFIENVRKISRVPAIALSGFGMEEDVAQGVASGFDAHLTKPVNFQNLDSAIRRLTSVS